MASQEYELKINKEYLDKIPRPDKEQYAALKESIKTSSQLEPIIVNEDYEILDGYTRFQICKELGITPKIQIRKFDTKEIESMFVRTVNLKRRHLSPIQIYELFEDEIEEIKKYNISQANLKKWAVRKGELPKNTPRSKYENSSQYKIMQITGLPAGTIEAVKFVKKHADEKLLKDVRDGNVHVFKAVNMIRHVKREHKDSRNKLHVLLSILHSVRDMNVPIKSRVSRRTNTSYYTLSSFVEPLVEHGLMTEHKEDKRIILGLTPKGYELINRIESFLEYIPKGLV